MLLYLFQGGSVWQYLLQMALVLPIMLFSLSVHEAMHGYVAWKLGDPTARNLGRLTLNPRRHIDPLGFLVLVLFGFGWARPVPINARYFKNPKWGFALSALAGPLSNIIIALLSAVLFGALSAFAVFARNAGWIPFWVTALDLFSIVFQFSAILNFIYAVFNLIPIPPYDGSRILFAFLPQRTYFSIMRYERQIMFALLAVLVLCSWVLPVSPFKWIAEKLTLSVANPVYRAIRSAL